MPSTFGALLKRLRLKAGLSLREFCLKYDFDPVDQSRLERGRYSPPKNIYLLEEYAEIFGLERGTTEWMELYDAAASERGEIPADLMADERIVNKLPVLFRIMRISLDWLDELLDQIKKGE